MPKVLSQSEIDNLLAGIGKEPASVAQGTQVTAKGEPDIQGFDFRRPNRVSKSQLKIFQAVHETFAELFGFYLASKLQAQVSITVSPVDQLFYSEYLITKTDAAVSLGTILSLAQDSRLPFSFITDGQSVPDDIEPASGSELAKMICKIRVAENA